MQLPRYDYLTTRQLAISTTRLRKICSGCLALLALALLPDLPAFSEIANWRAQLFYNSACIEAVDGEPVAGLSEVLRLAWLVSQLNADLPMYRGEIHRFASCQPGLFSVPHGASLHYS